MPSSTFWKKASSGSLYLFYRRTAECKFHLSTCLPRYFCISVVFLLCFSDRSIWTFINQCKDSTRKKKTAQSWFKRHKSSFFACAACVPRSLSVSGIGEKTFLTFQLKEAQTAAQEMQLSVTNRDLPKELKQRS